MCPAIGCWLDKPPTLSRAAVKFTGLPGIATSSQAGRRQTPGISWLRISRHLIGLLAVCALPESWSIAHAQNVEPRSFSPAPVGVNFLIIGYAETRGALSFDDAVALTDAKFTTKGPVLGYARTLDLWGKSGKFDVIVPTASFSGSALYQGEPVQRHAAGLADPLLRLSVTLHGAPAMTATQFRSYKQDWLVGVSVQVSVPIGQYDKTRLVNLGAHSWFVKPRIGVSKVVGPWTMELSGAATFFSANDNFYGGNRVTRKPIYLGEGHLVYSFGSGIWTSLDGTYFTGGRTALNGIPADNSQRNWRAGGTLVLPVNRRNSIKFYASTGISARTGNNYDLLGAAWQYRWGGGL